MCSIGCLLTAEGYSIYLRGLPGTATHALVENMFKKFGPIKSGGVQVRTAKVFHLAIPCFFVFFKCLLLANNFLAY
jgi:hypothetical protein